MSDELRTPKQYEEIEDISDNAILRLTGRLAQSLIGIVGASYILHSYAENGLSTESVAGSIFTLGLPLLIEYILRNSEQDVEETYNDQGVIDV